MRRKGAVVVCLSIGILVPLNVPPAAWADCGSIPFYAPLVVDLKVSPVDLLAELSSLTTVSRANPDVSFDPLQVTVFEPHQRAIILWNGTEEVLLLSTDQRASQQTAVLEVIPLPSEPKVRLGSFETFEKAQRLVVEKRTWAVAHGGAQAGLVQVPESAGRIAFQKKMGAHDVTVAQSLDRVGFVGFVQDHLKKRYGVQEAPIRPEFVEIIQSYLDDGYQWFVFDAIALGDSNQSRRPVEYRFRSNAVFYPMRISNGEEGTTKVDLLVFSSNGASAFEGLESAYFDKKTPLEVNATEVESLADNWLGFFGTDENPVMDQWLVEGDIRNFRKDVIVR